MLAKGTIENFVILIRTPDGKTRSVAMTTDQKALIAAFALGMLSETGELKTKVVDGINLINDEEAFPK